MHLEIWSDVVCPWCAIGRAHLDLALADAPYRDEVTRRWRSFELDPTAPTVREEGLAAHLAAKYGTDADGAREMIDAMTARAAAVGLTFDLHGSRPGRTFDAHRLLHLAHDRGIQDQVKDRFLTGYLRDRVAVGVHAELLDLAVDAGLDRAEVDEVLTGDRYADAVRADVDQAHAFGVSGVPFFVVDRRFAVSGAQPPEVLRGALDRAWAERGVLTTVGPAPGGSPARGHAADHAAHDHAGHDHAGHEPGDPACADGSCAI